MLYIAYGSNLDLSQMAHRCPKAEPLYSMMLPDYRLVFRGVADISEHPDASVPVGVFRITDECEKTLDVYEGVKSGLYEKRYFQFDGGGEWLLAYVMTPRYQNNIAPPSVGYYEGIARGYEDFNLDVSYLQKAKRHSYAHMVGGPCGKVAREKRLV